MNLEDMREHGLKVCKHGADYSVKYDSIDMRHVMC